MRHLRYDTIHKTPKSDRWDESYWSKTDRNLRAVYDWSAEAKC
jgi:hypothetical protein